VQSREQVAGASLERSRTIASVSRESLGAVIVAGSILRGHLLTALHVLSSVGALALAAPEPVRVMPNNVLVFVIDDVGVDMIGAYDAYFQSLGRAPGQPASTPVIDQLLAARGLTFASAWACPTCTPSRAQLLTGRHGFRTGIGVNLTDFEPVPSSNPGLSLDAVLLPELLKSALPFTCAAAGKWHLADLDQLATDLRHPLGNPPGRWFDVYAGSLFNLSRPTPPNLALSPYNDWMKAYASELVPGLDPCGSGTVPCVVAMSGPGPFEYATANTAEDAITLVSTLPEPWFVYVGFNACHAPVNYPIPAGMPTPTCPQTPPLAGPCQGVNEAEQTRCVMRTLDEQIGRVLCAVNESDTTVVLIGDNGSVADAILPPFDPSHAKGSLYEGGVNVPLIVRSPDLVPQQVGYVSNALVSNVDLFATIAELGGIPPALVQAEDSVSMVPYLHGQRRSIRSTVYSESFLPNFTPDPLTGAPPAGYFCTRHFQAVRTKRFKLIRRWNRDHNNPTTILVREEFYDLLRGGPPDMGTVPPTPTADPYEQNDLLQSGIAPGSVAERALLGLRQVLDTDYPTLVQ
jgi:arylsulfatase A-like enzyme